MKKSVLFLLLLITSLSGFFLAAIVFNLYLSPTTPPANTDNQQTQAIQGSSYDKMVW